MASYIVFTAPNLPAWSQIEAHMGSRAADTVEINPSASWVTAVEADATVFNPGIAPNPKFFFVINRESTSILVSQETATSPTQYFPVPPGLALPFQYYPELPIKIKTGS